MTCHEEEIDVTVLDRVEEPLLLDRLLDRLDDGVVGVSVEIEQEPERQNPDALILRGELPIPLSQGLELA